MERAVEKPVKSADRLMKMHRELFPKTIAPCRTTTDRNGNFVMPSAYRPTKMTYVSQVN